jgi:hypothetical protein
LTVTTLITVSNIPSLNIDFIYEYLYTMQSFIIQVYYIFHPKYKFLILCILLISRCMSFIRSIFFSYIILTSSTFFHPQKNSKRESVGYRW